MLPKPLVRRHKKNENNTEKTLTIKTLEQVPAWDYFLRVQDQLPRLTLTASKLQAVHSSRFIFLVPRTTPVPPPLLYTFPLSCLMPLSSQSLLPISPLISPFSPSDLITLSVFPCLPHRALSFLVIPLKLFNDADFKDIKYRPHTPKVNQPPSHIIDLTKSMCVSSWVRLFSQTFFVFILSEARSKPANSDRAGERKNRYKKR